MWHPLVRVFALQIFKKFIGMTLVNDINKSQVDSSIIHPLSTALCAHHPESSLLPSPFI